MQDVSDGGLCVRADIEVAEETPLTLSLKTASEPLIISCMVWHARQVRRGSTGQRFTQLGLVLVDPSEEFLQLVARLAANDATKNGRRPVRLKVVNAAEPTPKLALRRVLPPATETRGQAPPASPLAQPPVVEAPPPPAGQPFTVRVKQDGGPRTRRIVVGGLNKRDAEEKALVEIGEGWTILDVTRA